jgi:four helix bundle protein
VVQSRAAGRGFWVAGATLWPPGGFVVYDLSTRPTATGVPVVGFRDLKVWTKAQARALAVYQSPRAFPSEEFYGLTSQIRRSAVSISANIAEGCGRGGPNDFARFLQIGIGSASELEYHLLLAADLGLLDRPTQDVLQVSVIEVKHMLSGFIRTLKRRQLKADVRCLTSDV